MSIAGETNSNALPKRYTSVSLIARGGMGEVYRATDSVLQRKVAIKLLSERHAGEEDVRARFRREALAAARLSGTPHVITIFDVGEHRRRPYIVMEYLDGGSVHDRLREGPVPPGQSLEWLAQAGVALDRAHAEGIVHRDVKPANLLLDRDGNIVVSDFGIASTTGVDTLTLPGTILGTAGYLSPEQARGEPSTAASDRYGLGVVAFELLTGRRPFEGDTAATEAFAHVNAPVPSARSLYPELPPGVDDVLERALAKDPADRPVSCGELVRDLRDAFALRGVSQPAPTLVAPAAGVPVVAASRTQHRSPRPRYRMLAFAAAGLVVAGLASGALLSSIGDDGGGEARQTTSTQRTSTGQTSRPTTQTTRSRHHADDRLGERGGAEQHRLRTHAGRRLPGRPQPARAGGPGPRRLGDDARGLGELQPRLHPLRARPLRRRARAPRPLGEHPGRAAGDQPALPGGVQPLCRGGGDGDDD